MTQTAAEEHLNGTVSGDKNEILWSRFGINYNNEPDLYKKGSVVSREYAPEIPAGTKDGVRVEREEEGAVGAEDSDEADGVQESISKTQAEKLRKARRKARVVTKHVDIIRDDFWNQRPWLRTGKPGQPVGEHGEP